MADSKHTVTIDLNGLKLSDAEFKSVQDHLHATALGEIAKLPPFRVGIGGRPFPGGGFPIGIIIDRLQNANIGH